MRSWRSPASLFWLGGHIALIFIGALSMTTEGEKLLGATLGQSLGSGLLATGVAGLVLYLYVRSNDALQNRLEIIADAGLISVFRHRSMRIKDHYDSRLKKAKRIDLIGLGLSSFREDYHTDFVQWSHRADVRIMLIDSEFPTKSQSLADIRDIEERGTKGEIRADVEAFERTVAGLVDLNHDRFKLRRMRTIPAINLLRIDDEIFWGPYLMSERSRNTPTLLVRRGGFMFDTLVNHFEATWNAAESTVADT